MHKDESVKYLGDIVHKSGKAKVNMKERQVKAYAIVAEIISSRRIMYLQHILSRKSSELINWVYEAQKNEPTKGDFVETVNEDMAMIGENEDTIQMLSKEQLKKVVKTKIN